MSLATMSCPNDTRQSLRPLLQQALELGREIQLRKNRNRLRDYQPYSKQREFHDAGLEHRERLFMAGNQLGKTVAGSFEWAMHLTGRYPDWWRGRRFETAGRYWAAGESGTSTRDTVQKLLVGPPEKEEEWGTGAIPFSSIVDTQRARGQPDALDSIVVKHVTGGTSTCLFKSYEQGRAKWQGDTLNGVWFDEEPPADIYTEGLTRTNATGGITMTTFTPLRGMSEVVRMFLQAEV
jgi:phage terminase large subunit-like protein